MTAALPSTYLFVPGNRPERFAKALASGAGAIILDLEDAVAPQDKEAARAAVVQWLASAPAGPVQRLVRINDASTPWFVDDLTELAQAAPDGVMLPKAEDAITVAHVLEVLPPAVCCCR